MNLARPVYAVYLHENDRYYAYATGNGGYFYRDTRGHTIGSLQAFFIGLPSVWHHSDASGNLVAYSGGCDTFAYDAYGVLLQDETAASSNPGKVGTQATNLLYAGEQFDVDAQQYYLRARYYDQNNGRFNRMDPFSGSSQDPQSLHKYLYCHNNPINGVDPSGMFAINIVVAIAIVAIMFALPGCRSRAPNPGTNTYQNDILKVRIDPIIFLKTSERYRTPQAKTFEVEQLKKALTGVNNFWRKNAGIEFSWTEIKTVLEPNLLEMETANEIDEAVSKYYNGSIVLLVPETIEEWTSGMVSSDHNGCAVRNGSPAITIAHELAHVLIPTFWPHVYGKPTNLLSPGKHQTKYPLDELYLNQDQIDKARERARKKKWTITNEK